MLISAQGRFTRCGHTISLEADIEVNDRFPDGQC